MLMRNLTSGSPDDVIEKRMHCEQLGADEFEYHASMRLGRKDRKGFFELFCSEVLHGFQKKQIMCSNSFQHLIAVSGRPVNFHSLNSFTLAAVKSPGAQQLK